MKQRLFLTLFSLLILSPFYLSAQKKTKNLDIDSLSREISTLSRDKSKAFDLMMTYKATSQYYIESKQEDKALPFLEKGLKLARELKNDTSNYFFLYSLGLINYIPLDKYSTSIEYLLKADELGKTFSDSVERAKNQTRIANVYISLGLYDKALEYQLSSTRSSKETADTSVIANGFRVLGTIYLAQKSIEQAMFNFDRALLLSKYLTDSIKQFTIIAAVGAAFVEKGEYEKGKKYLLDAQKLVRAKKYKYGEAYTVGALGEVFNHQDKLEQAKANLTEAITLFDTMGIQNEATSFRIEAAEVYLKLKDYQKASEIVNQAEPTVAKINSLSLKRDFYQIKYLVFEELGETEKAYAEYKNYIQIKDSILSKERLVQLAKVQHQDKIMELEIASQKTIAQSASQQRKFIIIGFIIFSILLAGVLYWARLRTKELKKSNSQLEAQSQEIKMQVERLASSNEELRQFAHVTSHDLREPLRSISSFTTLLKRRYKGKIDPEADQFINFITDGVKRMDTLLSDLLAYSVVGIGRSEYEQVNINNIITNIIESLHREKATQGARISIHNLPELRANKKQLNQLFQHLIDNAIKFRSDESPEVSVSCQDHEEGHMFSIADNGIGMDEAYKDKIFGLFLRLHHKKTKYKGTGIGLSICKKIVEQHKGRIWIESKIGKGTTVHFILPKSPMKEIAVSPKKRPEIRTSAVNQAIA